MARNYVADGQIIGQDYCRCSDDEVDVELDTTSYSDCYVARCAVCGEELDTDVSNYEPEPTALELRCWAKDEAERRGHEPISHA